MASTVAHPECDKLRSVIRRLDKQVSNIKSMEFRPEELQRLGIRVISSSFSDTSEKTALDPCFFKPYPYDLLTTPREGFVVYNFPEYDAAVVKEYELNHYELALSLNRYLSDYLPECGTGHPGVLGNAFQNSGWRFKDVPDYKYKVLWEYDPPSPRAWIPEWYVKLIYHHCDTKFPHLKSTIVSDVVGNDETLFRSELLALIRMIRGRLATKSVAHHAVHPILMFSMMGVQHVRILQAHLNGTELVIQRSKLYDFRHKDDKLLELFAQWFLSNPVGDTKMV